MNTAPEKLQVLKLTCNQSTKYFEKGAYGSLFLCLVTKHNFSNFESELVLHLGEKKTIGMNYIDWIGFAGVFQILLAYVLNLSGKVNKEHLAFILLNLVGAGLACFASVLMRYLPFVILEGIWALVSLFALIKYKSQVQ